MLLHRAGSYFIQWTQSRVCCKQDGVEWEALIAKHSELPRAHGGPFSTNFHHLEYNPNPSEKQKKRPSERPKQTLPKATTLSVTAPQSGPTATCSTRSKALTISGDQPRAHQTSAGPLTLGELTGSLVKAPLTKGHGTASLCQGPVTILRSDGNGRGGTSRTGKKKRPCGKGYLERKNDHRGGKQQGTPQEIHTPAPHSLLLSLASSPPLNAGGQGSLVPALKVGVGSGSAGHR